MPHIDKGKSMLARLFGKKIDHPMAEMKAARLILDDLPKQDALKSLGELTEWIESVAACEAFKLEQRWELLCLLDETAQPLQRKLSAEYFSLTEINSFQGNRLCHALESWSGQMAQAYFALFLRYCDEVKKEVVLKSNLPVLVARTVRLLRAQLKYQAVHYRSHEATLWQHCSQLYRHAEQHHYLTPHVNLYHTLFDASSVQFEVAQLLAWHASGINGLTPLTLHILEQLMVHFASTIKLTTHLTHHALFCFDLAHPLNPVRVNLEATVHPLMRYVDLSEMQPKLAELIHVLGKGFLPQQLHLGGHFPVERVQEAALHVMTYLTAPPTRMSKRLEIQSGLCAVVGFERVLAFSRATMLPFPLQLELKDASNTGFCAILTGSGGDGLRIGQLLGIQTVGVSRLGVAVLRRMSRTAEGGLLIGAEILANRINDVLLSERELTAGEMGLPALWLHEKITPTSHIRLLMPPGSFTMLRSLKCCLSDKHYLLIPNELHENGLDFDLASFRLIEQDSSGDAD